MYDPKWSILLTYLLSGHVRGSDWQPVVNSGSVELWFYQLVLLWFYKFYHLILY